MAEERSLFDSFGHISNTIEHSTKILKAYLLAALQPTIAWAQIQLPFSTTLGGKW
jgi:hypothetical protein